MGWRSGKAAPAAAKVRAETRFRRGALWLFGVLVATLALLGVQIQITSTRYAAELRWIAHSRDVQMAVPTALAAMHAAEADLRGFLVSGDATYLDRHVIGLGELSGALAALDRLVADNPAQAARARGLASEAAELGRHVAAVRHAQAAGGVDAARAAFARIDWLATDADARRQAADLLAGEQRLLERRRAHAAATASSTRWLGISAVVICLFELTLGYWLLVREQHRRTLGQRLLERSNAELAAALATSRQLADTMRNLTEFGEMLQGCRSHDEAIVGVRSTLAHLLPGCAGTLNLINPSQNVVEAMTSWGAHPIETSPLFAPDDCWALRRGQPFPPLDAARSFTCRHVALPDPAHPQAAYFCVPLLANGEIFGVLHLTSAQAIGAETRGVAVASAEQISLTLANLKLQDSLRTQSLRDPLTGLFNRRRLESSLEREALRARRHGLSFAVLMIDLDDFKRFNDEHGHDAGDALLSEFSRLLQRTLGSDDVVFRYGGEEFTAILTDAGAEAARERAEAICAGVRDLRLQHRHEVCRAVTASIGIAVCPIHGTTAADLLHRADKALYASKRGGKDRATMASHALVVPHPAGRGDAGRGLASPRDSA